jgi:gas vesicle protein
MKKETDREELDEKELRGGRDHRSGMLGAIALAGVVGLGVGLLAAPQPGERTRKALRKRLASLGEELEEGLEEVEEKSRPARKELRERASRLRERGEKAWEDLEERLDRLENKDEDDDSGLTSLLTFAAGLAATYFLTSERAAPTRAKVREAATTFRQRATDRWDRFQERRSTNGGARESGAQPETHAGGAGEA